MTDELQQVADEIAEILERHDVAAMTLLIGQESVILEHYGIEDAMRRLGASAGQGLETFKKFVALKQVIAEGNAGDLDAVCDPGTVPPASPGERLARAFLMFSSPDEWNAERKREWRELTGNDDATTKALRDLARAVLAEARMAD